MRGGGMLMLYGKAYRYCSGQLGMDPETKEIVEGGISERTVCHLYLI